MKQRDVRVVVSAGAPGCLDWGMKVQVDGRRLHEVWLRRETKGHAWKVLGNPDQDVGLAALEHAKKTEPTWYE